MLRVCSTAPMAGMARYASRWPWLFQQKVPTRSPGSMPSRVRAAASFSARVATSAKVAWRLPALLDGDDGAVAVDLLPVAQDVSDQERGVLHGALHAPSMASAPLPCPRRLGQEGGGCWPEFGAVGVLEGRRVSRAGPSAPDSLMALLGRTRGRTRIGRFSKRSVGACMAVLAVGLLACGCDWVRFWQHSGLNGDNAGETAITPSNVSTLAQQFSASDGSTGVMTPQAVVNGILYASDANGLEAYSATGRRNARDRRRAVLRCGAIRGCRFRPGRRGGSQ